MLENNGNDVAMIGYFFKFGKCVFYKPKCAVFNSKQLCWLKFTTLIYIKKVIDQKYYNIYGKMTQLLYKGQLNREKFTKYVKSKVLQENKSDIEVCDGATTPTNLIFIFV